MKMIDVFVKYNETQTEYYHDGEQWGEWHASYDFSIEGVSLTAPSHHEYEKLGLENVKPGDVVYVFWMTYSTGDSFGHATGQGEVLWVFKDPNLALAAKQKFMQDKEQYLIEINTDDGKTFTLSNPASGYFENLGELEISTFLVNP